MDFQVKVIPKASKTEFVGYLPDGTWKVKIAAAPEKGMLGVAKSSVQIVSGETSHLKRIRVS
jgi:uncharacterized protein YggU (UPF0235/DUF167 family)